MPLLVFLLGIAGMTALACKADDGMITAKFSGEFAQATTTSPDGVVEDFVSATVVTITLPCADWRCDGTIEASGITPLVPLRFTDGSYVWAWDEGERELTAGRRWGCDSSSSVGPVNIYRTGVLSVTGSDDAGPTTFALEWKRVWALDASRIGSLLVFNAAGCTVSQFQDTWEGTLTRSE